jgi:putative thiamine transport system substrate-binding protein
MPLIALILSFLLLAVPSLASDASLNLDDWKSIEAKARGQIVYWNAWAGEKSINAYIAWAAGQVEKRYGVQVEHVKLSDTAEAVAKVIAEKAAGRESGGTVDIIWINGPNFTALKKRKLLFGPWARKIPNYAFLSEQEKPTLARDFAEPTEGYEVAWDLAQLVFYYDSARIKTPPRNIQAFLDYAHANPGRLTYPDVQNFLGATFLKQLLVDLVPDASVLLKAPSDDEFARTTQGLWQFLDEINPLLWRQGKAFPANSAELRQLLADNEIDIAFSFNPAEASLAIVKRELPASVRSYVLDGGTIGNASFLAIPFNAASKEGALVLANFLLSPEAQARKQDPAIWGGLSVVSIAKLNRSDRELFDRLKPGAASLSPSDLGRALPEPHADWMTRITAMWLERYASQ